MTEQEENFLIKSITNEEMKQRITKILYFKEQVPFHSFASLIELGFEAGKKFQQEGSVF